MTSSLGFYIKPQVLKSNSFNDDDDDLFVNQEDDEDFDNNEYLQEVPYTSSSVDRSSIGSIPWADDAIKINKLEWERVEKMLCGLEPLTTVEDNLKNEVLDWRKKFPQLISENQKKNKSVDFFDIESLPSLGLASEEEDGKTETKITLSRDYVVDISTPIPSLRKLPKDDSNNLCQQMDNFTLNAVPLKLSKREMNKSLISKRKCASSTSSCSLLSPPTPTEVPLDATTRTSRFRMPPILNVLESRRKFRSFAKNKNPSFVQLTQVQQAKSAAVAQEQKSRSPFQTGHRSAWHVPLAANRFLNNRNSIILPSISSKHQVKQYSTQPTTTSTSSEMGTTTSSSGPKTNLLKTNNYSFTHNLTAKHQLTLGGFTTNMSNQTNASNTTSGRSISAAVQYPKITTFNALYLPYSAFKFHTFK